MAQEDGWPRTLPVDAGLVTIYPPQVDSMEGDVVRYRAALAYRPTADAEPIFGAGWFESAVDVDRANRIVHPRDLKVVRTRFPDGTGDLQARLAEALAAESPRWNLDFPLDRLEADLQTVAAEQKSLQKLNTAPPDIVYRDRPALLVTLDGQPLLRAIEDSSYQAVINTPYPLLFDGQRYYLNVAKDVWYQSDRATGPYRFETSPPAGIAALVQPEADSAADAPAVPITASNAPEIVVATRPTELIVPEGPAVFVPLVDDLLVLQNSDDDVFMHVGSQDFYIVLAGRWYHAKSLDGPWSYQAADQLPPAFANIPRDSRQADALAHVAGTAEAEEAVLDAQVPQTAAVARGPAEVDVSYDGEPDFRPVDGTDLEYAANTGATVLQADRRYYLVEDGVWYLSDSPNGPWQVSAWRPQAVSQIAPTSPVYHVKYVYIYDSTPDVVYVGYTPGYLGNYRYYGTVVYGTGWYYRPWVSPYYYYPRPSTWGFHVSYNPWSGWGFGLSWNWGLGWGWDPYYSSYWSGGYWHRHHHWHHRYYGYWGPRGYRPRPVPYAYHGHDRGYAAPRNGSAYRDRSANVYGGRNENLYRDPGQRARFAERRDVHPPANAARRGSQRYPGRALEPTGRELRRSDNAAYAGNRNDRVTPDDLRLKARIRDVNQSAARSLMVADSSGKVQRKAKRQPQLETTRAQSAAPAARVGQQKSTRPAATVRDVVERDRKYAAKQPVDRGARPKSLVGAVPRASNDRAVERQVRQQALADSSPRQAVPSTTAARRSPQAIAPAATERRAPPSQKRVTAVPPPARSAPAARPAESRENRAPRNTEPAARADRQANSRAERGPRQGSNRAGASREQQQR
jgi:hypothetical protein